MYNHIQISPLRVVAAMLMVLSCACSSPQNPDDNLLLHKKAVYSEQVARGERITDGINAADGADWLSAQTATMAAEAAVIYDLGQTYTVDTMVLQCTNNDVYRVLVSDDGINFRIVWWAGSISDDGNLGTRYATSMNATGRYLKAEVYSGDGEFAIAEFSAYLNRPEHLPEPKIISTE